MARSRRTHVRRRLSEAREYEFLKTHIREARLILGLPQSIVASRMGISVGHYNHVEIGPRPLTLDFLQKASDALSLSPGQVVRKDFGILHELVRAARARLAEYGTLYLGETNPLRGSRWFSDYHAGRDQSVPNP